MHRGSSTLTSAKRSGHWDAGCEFSSPDPIFTLAVVLSCCGYALRCWCGGVVGLRLAKALAKDLKCWRAGLLERSHSEVLRPENSDLANPTWSSSFHPTKSLNQRAETCQRDLFAFDVTVCLNVQCMCLTSNYPVCVCTRTHVLAHLHQFR